VDALNPIIREATKNPVFDTNLRYDAATNSILFNILIDQTFTRGIDLNFSDGLDLGFAKLNVTAAADAKFEAAAKLNAGVGIDLNPVGGAITRTTRLAELHNGQGVRYTVGMAAEKVLPASGVLDADVHLTLHITTFDGSVKDVPLTMLKSATANNTDRVTLFNDLNDALQAALGTHNLPGTVNNQGVRKSPAGRAALQISA
jgi:hypothetical protein